MQLILVRHAQPERVEGVAHADPDLTSAGRAQAAALRDWWTGRTIDAAVTSPAARARQTAEIACAGRPLDLVIDDRVREFDWGASDYVPFEDARAEGGMDALVTVFTSQAPEAIAWRAGVVAAIDQLVDTHPGKHVAVFCHGGAIATYVASMSGARPTALATDYTGVTTVLASRSGERTLRAHNETGHLLAATRGWLPSSG